MEQSSPSSRLPRPRAVRVPVVLTMACLLSGCGDWPVGPRIPSGAELHLWTILEHVEAGGPLNRVEVSLRDPHGQRLDPGAARVRIRIAEHPSGARLIGDTTSVFRDGVAMFEGLHVDRPAYDIALEAVVVGTGIGIRSEPFHSVESSDRIHILNATPGSGPDATGIIVDGQAASGFVNDLRLWSDDGTADVILERADLSNDVVAFQRGHAPALVQADWSRGPDSIALALGEPVPIPITVWVVAGGAFDRIRSLAETALAEAQEIFDAERAGIRLVDFEFLDATAFPEAARYAFFPFELDSLFADIGHRDGRINIYGVSSLGAAGRADIGGTFIGIAHNDDLSGWRGQIVAHELGHNFSLGHSGNLEGFDGERLANLMTGGLGLTEGQIFAMHFSTRSVMNRVFQVNPDLARDCPLGLVEPDPQRPDCLPLDLRLWADPDPPASATPHLAPSACGPYDPDPARSAWRPRRAG